MTLLIVTDSTADIDPDQSRSLNITVVPLTVYFDGRAYLDGIELGPAEFFQRLPAANPLPRTAAPAPGAFLETFEHLATRAAEILCITISSKLSATYSAARAGRDQYEGSARIEVMDSFGATAALANVVLSAARAAHAGAGLDAARAVAERARDSQEILIGLETLEYLQRGGRIGRARAFVGGILHFKPLLTLVDGEVAPAERVRSRARMIDRLYRFATDLKNPEVIRIVHAAAPADCEKLAERIRAERPQALVETGWIGSVVGVYSGPDALGIALVPRLAL